MSIEAYSLLYLVNMSIVLTLELIKLANSKCIFDQNFTNNSNGILSIGLRPYIFFFTALLIYFHHSSRPVVLNLFELVAH